MAPNVEDLINNNRRNFPFVESDKFWLSIDGVQGSNKKDLKVNVKECLRNVGEEVIAYSVKL